MDHIISYNVEHIIVISLPERSIGAIFLTHLRSRPAASLGIGLQETTCWKMSPHWYLGTTKRRGSAERVCQGGASHLVNDVNGLYHVVPPVNPSYIYILYYIYMWENFAYIEYISIWIDHGSDSWDAHPRECLSGGSRTSWMMWVSTMDMRTINDIWQCVKTLYPWWTSK